MITNDFLDFDDIEIKPKFKEKYKGIPGERHRLAIIWPKPEEKANGKPKGPFEKRRVHYADKYFFCKDGVCCEKLGPSKERISCLVIKYKTKKDGIIVKAEGEKLPFSFEVLEWVFADKKFNQLKALHAEWDLKNHDMYVSCEGSEQYQDLTFTPCKESLFQLRPEYKEEIYRETEPSRANLVRALGQDLSIEEIKEILGLEVSQPIDAVSGGEDLDKILDEM